MDLAIRCSRRTCHIHILRRSRSSGILWLLSSCTRQTTYHYFKRLGMKIGRAGCAGNAVCVQLVAGGTGLYRVLSKGPRPLRLQTKTMVHQCQGYQDTKKMSPTRPTTKPNNRSPTQQHAASKRATGKSKAPMTVQNNIQNDVEKMRIPIPIVVFLV